jgi:hypothetical protein
MDQMWRFWSLVFALMEWLEIFAAKREVRYVQRKAQLAKTNPSSIAGCRRVCGRLFGMTSPRVPRIGERVQVEGHEGRFIVVRIDKVESVASLELWDNPDHVLRGIPFRAIRLIRQDVNQAA